MRNLIVILFTACSAVFVNGQIISETLDFNGISATVSASGLLFNNSTTLSPGFEYPKNSGKHLIFSMADWYSGTDNWGLKMAASEGQFFAPHENGDFSPGPLTVNPGTGSPPDLLSFGAANTDPTTMQNYNKVWVVRKAEIDSFIVWSTTSPNWPGYTVPSSIVEWPAHGDVSLQHSYYLAPFIDINGDGNYDPYSDGDYPDINGDFCAFTIYNDKGSVHQNSGADPIGLEIHQMVYGYITDLSCPNHAALNATLFIERRIINRSVQSLTNFSMGIFMDPDIGNGTDDYVGCDVNRSMIYSYNGDIFDDGATGYGSSIPALGLVILEGIRQDPTGVDDSIGIAMNQSINGTGYGNGIIDDEKFGLTGFTYLDGVGGLTSPNSADDRYKLMNGLYTNGSPFMNPEGPTNFIYPDSSNSFGYLQAGAVYSPWNEINAVNSPGDRRILATSGNCSFTPGQYHDVKFAVVAGPSTIDGVNSVEALQLRVDKIRLISLASEPCLDVGIEEVSTIEVSLYPNPAHTVLYLKGISEEAEVGLFDACGVLVMKLSNNHTVNIENLQSGMYLVRIKDKELTTLKFIKE